MGISGAGRSTMKPPGMENPFGGEGQTQKNLCGVYGYFLEPHIDCS